MISHNQQMLYSFSPGRRTCYRYGERIGADSLPYALGLFFHTLQGCTPELLLVRQPKQVIARLLHRLMFAGMLAEKIARQAAPGEANSSQPTGISIDEKNHVASVDGRQVHLTPTEFDLLLRGR